MPVGLVIAAVLCAFIYVHIRARLDYARLDLGMSADVISDLLGEPDRRESQMIFCAAYLPWSGECPEPGTASHYWYFKYGIDRWIVIGFGDDERVQFKTLGDT